MPTCLHPATSASGYPSDPLTKAWLKAFLEPTFGWPSVARFSWAPAKDALEARGVPVQWPDDDAPGGGGGGQARLSAFFAATGTGRGLGGAAGQRSAWRRKRMLEPFE